MSASREAAHIRFCPALELDNSDQATCRPPGINLGLARRTLCVRAGFQSGDVTCRVQCLRCH